MRRSGFSLVELSIVLVILGLLVGGILGGQSLIRAAELRSITTDRDKYITAINSFREKYNALPGDMTNATDYWGAANATNSTCLTTARVDNRTCNGNGDGKIKTDVWELSLAWEHMALAGLIEGNYRAYTAANTSGYYTPHIYGVNTPKLKISGGGVILIHVTDWAGWADGTANYMWKGKYSGHTLNFTRFNSATPAHHQWGHTPAFLTVEDAEQIDRKVDDGKPGLGQVKTILALGFGGDNCTTGNNGTQPENADWNRAYKDNACGLQFTLDF